ncbi:MAG: hypothetical protein ACPGJS_03460 [Flammeovirgaceae bacterium]
MKVSNNQIRTLLLLCFVFNLTASVHAQIEGSRGGTDNDILRVNKNSSYEDAALRLMTRSGNWYRDWNIWNNRQDGKLFFSYWSGSSKANGTEIGSYRMTLTSGGNLGIGTQSPAQRLDVSGSTIIRSNLHMDDGDIYDVRGFQLKDWDDNSGGSNNKYRLLARDGAWMFYNGGVVVGDYNDGSWSDVPTGRLIVKEKLGVGKTPTATLDVNGSAAISSMVSLQAGNGKGYRFWNSDNYKIHMGDSDEYKYGPVQDYSIKMNMNNQANRGWTWGVAGQTPIAALNTQGHMKIAGNLTASNVIVGVSSFPDYVFADDYKLLSLEEVDQYIQKHKHLPNIPAAAEIEKEGMDVGKLNVLLTEKVEELTLYTIQQNQQLKRLQAELNELKAMIKANQAQK